MRLQRKSERHKRGYHKMVSDRSGQVFPANEIVRQWDGLLVHKSEEEPRHPQEFVRGVVDDYTVREPRDRAPYEKTLSTGNTATFSVELVDRSGNELIDRGGNILRTRGEIFTASDNIVLADIGSVKSVSFVKFKFTELNTSKNRLNIYTSEDGSTYTGLGIPFVDAVRDFTVGDEVTVPVGRLARYVALRFEPIQVQVQANIVLTQFDVIGEV